MGSLSVLQIFVANTTFRQEHLKHLSQKCYLVWSFEVICRVDLLAYLIIVEVWSPMAGGLLLSGFPRLFYCMNSCAACLQNSGFLLQWYPS